MTFQSPALSRAAPIIVVVFLIGLALFLGAQVLGLAALLNPYTLLGSSGLALALVLHTVRSPWRLLLESDAVWVGAARHGRWVRYDSIRFLETVDKSSRAQGRMARLTISTDRRKHAIELTSSDARLALRALRERAPQASGVTADGQAFVSSDAASAALGARRVRRVLRWRAAGWAGLALLVCGGILLGGGRLLADPSRFLPLCALATYALWKAGRMLLRVVSAPRR